MSNYLKIAENYFETIPEWNDVGIFRINDSFGIESIQIDFLIIKIKEIFPNTIVGQTLRKFMINNDNFSYQLVKVQVTQILEQYIKRTFSYNEVMTMIYNKIPDNNRSAIIDLLKIRDSENIEESLLLWRLSY